MGAHNLTVGSVTAAHKEGIEERRHMLPSHLLITCVTEGQLVKETCQSGANACIGLLYSIKIAKELKKLIREWQLGGLRYGS